MAEDEILQLRPVADYVRLTERTYRVRGDGGRL